MTKPYDDACYDGFVLQYARASRPGFMSQRKLLVPGLTLALFTAAIGCRDSANTVQSSSAASPKPAAQAQKPAAPQIAAVPAKPKPEPDLADVVPVKTFQAKLPASFNGDELPQGPIEFTLAGHAGELLLVKTKEIPGVNYYRGDN